MCQVGHLPEVLYCQLIVYLSCCNKVNLRFQLYLTSRFKHILRSRIILLLAESTSQKLSYFSLSIHKYKSLSNTDGESYFLLQFCFIGFIRNAFRILRPSITLRISTRLYCRPFVSLQDLSMPILTVTTIKWD